MSKSLSTIQTVFKVLRIISKVVGIICLVGGIMCGVGILVSLIIPLMPDSIEKIIKEEADTGFLDMAFECIGGAVICISEAVIAFMSERYFARELEAGTPFTYEGSKELFRLGIISLAVPLGVSVFLGLLLGIFNLISVNGRLDISNSVSFAKGIIFMFSSLIFKYGAELEEKRRDFKED